MIQCPICQMINDDQSRFCNECGARIVPGQTVGIQDLPPSSASVPSPPVASMPMEKPDTPGADSIDKPGARAAKNPGKKLRSPLLAAEEFDDEPYQEPLPIPNNRTSGKHHLHSPLLGSGDGIDDDIQPENKHHLHSPLLDNGPSANSGRSLRSPLLSASGSTTFEEIYDEDNQDPYADDDNPNILRSPLLSAKVSLDEAHIARKAPPAKPLPSVTPLPEPKPIPVGALPPAKPLPPINPPPEPKPAPFGGATFGQPIPTATNQAPPAVSGQINANPAAGISPFEEFPDMTQFRRESSDISTADPLHPPQVSGQPQAAVIDTPLDRSAKPAAPSTKAEITAKPLKRSSSKMLGSGVDEPDESYGSPGLQSPRSFASEPETSSSPVLKICGIFVLVMALLKAVAIMQYMPTQMGQYPPFLLDEFGTLFALFAVGAGFILSRK